jgi:hypothetical protein
MDTSYGARPAIGAPGDAVTDAAVWLRVSAGHQDSDNQVPDVERFAAHHGYEITERYVVSDSAWKTAAVRATCCRRSQPCHDGLDHRQVLEGAAG